VDSLGNWHRPEDIEMLSHGDPEQARQLIGQELDWLFGLGVRQITPIHLANNAFGGTAIYLRFLEAVNMFLSGEGWTVKDAWETGVRYRMDHDDADVVDDIERTVMISGKHERSMHRHTLLDHIPGIRTLYEALEAPKMEGGHANSRGLNLYGKMLLEEMMARGMIIDVDHMSEQSTEETLTIVEQKRYPVICSHTWFRDLLFSAQTEFDPEKHENFGTSDVHKVAHEASKRGDQVERIGKLGGIVAPILNQGDIAGLRQSLSELADKIPEPCAGSSTSWAQAYLYAVSKMGGRGVAMGSDINGAAGLPGPRFGTFAAYGARNDALRTVARRGEIDRQTNGVAYNEPIRDYRWHRFEPSGAGAYDEEETNIWQAIAQYVAGFNPATDIHPETDFPELNVREALELLHVQLSHDWVDHVTQGIWMAELGTPVGENEQANWPEEQQAAYLALKDMRDEGLRIDHQLRDLIIKIKTIWAKWQQMKGDNRPLIRSMAGPRRDFDINLDGMAHYGMLPDFLQEVRNIGLTAEDLIPLFQSANDYIQMWSSCGRIAAEIVGSKENHNLSGQE
jgi:microsomal dipeptidase-like Zn-dependent dipeptidase